MVLNGRARKGATEAELEAKSMNQREKKREGKDDNKRGDRGI